MRSPRRGKLRVAADVVYARSLYDPVGPGRQGKTVDGRHHADRYASPLDLLCYRCTATIASASGRYEEGAVHVVLEHLLGHLRSSLRAFGTEVPTPGIVNRSE